MNYEYPGDVDRMAVEGRKKATVSVLTKLWRSFVVQQLEGLPAR